MYRDVVTVNNSRSTDPQPIAGAKTTCPFANCSMDLITDLPSVNNYDSILVMVDNLFKRFGLPDRIISDRDPQFAAKAFQELLKLLNVTSSLSTAYHPQTDGATE